MSEITVGSVGVEIVPDARQFASRIRAQILPDATRLGQDYGKTLGDAAQKRIADGVQKGVQQGARDAGTQGAKAGDDYGGKFGTALKARLDAALKSLPTVKLDADSSDADRAIDGIRTHLAELRGARIGVDITDAEAIAQIDTLEGRLRDLARTTPSIQVRTDALAAVAELERIAEEVRRLNGDTAHVNVDADTAEAEAKMDAFKASSLNASSGLGALATTALALGPALVPIGTAGAGAMAAIAIGAGAAAGAVGVLALALAPVIAAAQAVSQAQEQQGASAASAVSKTLQLASAQDAVKTAQRGVTDAIIQAHEDEIRSTEQVANAQQSLADAKRRSAEDQQQSAQRITDAEQALSNAESAAIRSRISAERSIADAQRSLADAQHRAAQTQVQAAQAVQQAEQQLTSAQRSALDAQQRLNDARAQAARDMEDLANQVVDGHLAEREAVLQVQEAQQQLNAALENPASIGAQREHAQLAYEEAVQHLKEQQLQNQRLGDEQAKSSAAGVDGAQIVKDAQQRLIDAQQQVVNAQQRVADAVTAAAEQQRQALESVAQAELHLLEAQEQQNQQQITSAQAVAHAQQVLASAQHEAAVKQRDDAETVARAQQSVADAIRQSADQQRKSAEAVQSAQQGVINAQRSLQQAAISAGNAGGASMASLQAKLAALSPAGREFVSFITGTLKPAFDDLSRAAQTGFLPGLEAGFKALQPVFPAFRQAVGEVATVLGTLARSALTALAGPFWQQFFGVMARTAVTILPIMGRTVGALATAFATLLEAFAPVAVLFAQGFAKIAQQFAAFLTSKAGQEALQSFLAYMVANGPAVGKLILDIASAGLALIKALAPAGPVVLGIVDAAVRFIAAIPPDILLQIIVAVTGLIVAMKAFAVVMAIVNAVMDANPFVLIGLAIVGLVVLVINLYNHWQTFHDIVNKVWAGIQAATSFAWNNIIKPVFNAIVGFVTGTLIPAFDTYLLPIIQLVWGLIKFEIQLAWSVIQVIFRAIVAFIQDVLGPVFHWLYDNVIQPVWEHAIKPVFQALGDFISTYVAPAFRAGVAAIKTAWNAVAEVAKKPVQFIVQTVINEGIIDTWNKIAGFFHVAPVEHVQLPAAFQSSSASSGLNLSNTPRKAFASGGYTGEGGRLQPAGIVHAGEFVFPQPAVHALGVPFLGALAGLPGYASGGLVGSIGSGLAGLGGDLLGLFGDAAGWLRSHIGDPLRSLIGAVGDSPFVRLVAAVPKALIDAAIHAVTSLIGGGGGGGGPAAPTGSATGANQILGRQLAASLYGWAGADWDALRNLWTGESAWNERALNQSSGAYGIPQSLPASKMASAGADWLTNPATQIRWGLGYISAAYGSPSNAYAKWLARSPHWYDDGGYIPPGVSVVANGTGRPEPVLTGTQWDAITSSRSGPTFGDIHVTNQYPEPELPSESTTRIMRRAAQFGPVTI